MKKVKALFRNQFGYNFMCQDLEEKCLEVFNIGRDKLGKPGFTPIILPRPFPFPKHFICMLFMEEQKVSDGTKLSNGTWP